MIVLSNISNVFAHVQLWESKKMSKEKSTDYSMIKFTLH